MSTQSQAKSYISKLVGSSSPDIPSGYTLNQLSQCTYSGTADCTYIYNTLIDKCKDTTDVNTKFKCIRTIKYCIVNGSSEFKQLCQRNNTDIRNCTTYRSTKQDAMTGNAANVRLNNEANECIKLMFDDSVQTHTTRKLDSLSNTPQITESSQPSFSSKFSTSKLKQSPQSRYGDDDDDNDTNEYQPSKYGGYGSSMPTTTNNNNKYSTAASLITNKLSTTANTIANAVSETVRSNQYASEIVDRVSNKIQQYSPNKHKSNKSALSYNGSNTSTYGNGYNNMNNHGFHGFDDNSNNSNSNNKQPYQEPQINTQTNENTHTSHNTDTDYDNSVEYKLVDSITVQSGIKTIPTNTELTQFSQAIQSLNIDIVLNRLIHNRLHSTQPAPVKLKSLAVLQHMLSLNNDISTQTQSYIDEHIDIIQALTTTTNTQLKQRATQLLQAIGQHTTQPATTQSNKQSNSAIDILNFTDDKPTEPADEFDMFDMNNNTQSTTQQTKQQQSSPLDFMADVQNRHHTTAQPTTTNTLDSMFGDMSLNNATTNTPSVSQHSIPQTNHKSSASTDLLNFGTASNGFPSLMDTLGTVQPSSNDTVSQLLASQQQKQKQSNFFPTTQQPQLFPQSQQSSQFNAYNFNVTAQQNNMQQPSGDIPFATRQASNTSSSDFAFVAAPNKPNKQASTGTNSDSFSFVSDLLKQ